MRAKIRIYSLCIIVCMLIASITGCKASETGNMVNTSAPDASPTASPDQTGDNETPSPTQASGPMAAWQPIVEEDLSEASLDTWMDMRLKIMDYASAQDLHAFMESSFPTVSVEVADAMAWEYVKILRDRVDGVFRYSLTPDVMEGLLYAYKSDGSFDRGMLDDAQKYLLDSIEGLEIGWIVLEGMIEPRVQYDQLLDWMTPCSPVFKEYLRLMAMDNDQMPAMDGALQIGFDELADRTLACEDFLAAAQGAPFIGDAEDLYLRYLSLLLSGADYPSVFDMDLYYESDALVLNPDAEEAFQYVLDTAPLSQTAVAVSDWWGQLREVVDSGATGENVYQHLWDDFSLLVTQYAAAAGVRTPRVDLATRTEETDTDIFYAKMEYPYLYGEGMDEGVLTELCDWIEGDLRDFYSGVQDLARSNYDSDFDSNPYGAYSELHLSRNAGPVVSVVADTESYTGGAHGMPVRIGYNFDPATGAHLQLSDLFKPDADPWALLEADVTRQIGLLQARAAELDEYQDYVPYDAYAGLSPEQAWYANDEGIVVVFTVYEIAPYAAGIPEFTVPWWRLKDYLAE